MHVKIILFTLVVYQNLLIVLSCERHETCRQCLTDTSMCVWCASVANETDIKPRCRSKETYDPKWCLGLLDTPEEASAFASLNNNFNSTDGHVVQIKPQIYTMKLRPGQPLEFKFSFQSAKDYPVDLYMLLDASKTMSILKGELLKHSGEIYKTLRSMTQNVMLGFGTYVDKNTPPYTSFPETNKAYSYRNRLNMTTDYNKLKKSINETLFTVNNDTPEGGFDALAQAIACKIGWREKSRKIIVFLTDSPHHVVGDGRSGGIFQPFDGKCYTDENGIYTKELEMDYPSLTMINRLVLEKKVIIIFALKDNVHETFYSSLLDVISDSRMANLGKKDIVAQLIESYKEISTNIKLEVDVKSGGTNVDIKFDPDCYEKASTEDCKVETGARRDFTGTITLNKYNGEEEIDISVQGINEKLKLVVDAIKCTCEAHEELTSPYCNNQKRQCGACICDPSTYGNRCMCQKGKLKTDSTDDSPCIAPGDSKVCSESGHCECGNCKCHKETQFGGYCECDRTNCPGYKASDADGTTVGTVCGGHGDCRCSTAAETKKRKEICKCDEGWTFKQGAEYLGCVCRDSKEDCMTANNTICNNRGTCSCNACKCDSLARWDQRFKQDSFCQVKPCPECLSMQCAPVRTCVLCHLESDNCEEKCDGIVLEKKHDVLPNEYLNSSEWNLCDSQKVGAGCYTKFVYKYDDEKYRILLQMQDDADCAESYYLYGGIIFATLLVAGILTLLAWKCLTRYQDIKEYNKFEAANKNVLDRASVNPLYNEATTSFRNPAFKKSFS